MVCNTSDEVVSRVRDTGSAAPFSPSQVRGLVRASGNKAVAVICNAGER
jgi:hypothetical protein